MSNQNRSSLIKFGLGVFLTIIPFERNFLHLAAQAQISSPTVEDKLNKSSQVDPKSTVRGKDRQTEPNQEPLDFSASGRSGQQTAGESRGNCPQVNVPLTAIAPKSNVSKTTNPYPQLWFYLPYQRSQISKIEFVLQDRERNEILRENLTVPPTIPYLSAKIPQSYPALKPNLLYRWYLKVYCLGKENTVPLYVSGWLHKISPHPEHNTTFLTATDYAQQDLWLDAIDLLVKSQISNPTASQKDQWQKIICSPEIDLELPDPKTANIVIK